MKIFLFCAVTFYCFTLDFITFVSPQDLNTEKPGEEATTPGSNFEGEGEGFLTDRPVDAYNLGSIVQSVAKEAGIYQLVDLPKADTKNLSQPIQNGNKTSFAENTIPDEGKKHFHNHHLDLWEAPFEIRKLFPFYLAGHDEERRPIWVSEMGKYDIRRIVSAGGSLLDALNKYADQAIHLCERSMEEASTPSNLVEEVVFICDFDQLDMSQVTHLATVQFMISVVRRHRNFMDRHLHVALAINANYAAKVLVGLVRPILGPIMERVELYGTNKERWLPQLLKRAPRSQLPPWYGGLKNFTPVQIYG